VDKSRDGEGRRPGGRQVRTVVGKRKAAERSGPQSAEIDDDWRRAQTRRAVAGHHLHVEGHHRIRSGGVWVTHSGSRLKSRADMVYLALQCHVKDIGSE